MLNPKKINKAFSCIFLCFFSGTLFAANSLPRVEVFALSTIPMVNTLNAQVYYLDGIAQLENALSDGLPPNQELSEKVVQERIRRLGPQIQEQMRSSGVGLGRALQLKIQRVPAIVFDGKYIVYGLTDVDAARRIHGGRK